MGIRVHKLLGYGLVDVQVNETRGEVDDPRIDADVVKDLRDNGYTDERMNEYREWLEARAAATDEHLVSLDRWYLSDQKRNKKGRGNAKKTRTLEDCWHSNPEYGLGNIVLFQPMNMSKWYRYDDDIDYVEESYLCSEPQANRFEVLRHGIYPYNARYMDPRTGVELDWNKISSWIRMHSRALESPEEDLSHDLEALAQAAGFRDHDDAVMNCVPVVPEEIKNFLEFTGLFRDPNTWRQLRPMLYVYWG